jgi:hypothetical protein
VLRHRIGLTYEAEAENVTQEDIIDSDFEHGRSAVMGAVRRDIFF